MRRGAHRINSAAAHKATGKKKRVERRRKRRRSRRRTAQVGGVGALVGFCFGRQTLFGWQQ